MPAQLPRVVKDLNAFVDGIGYAGRVTSATLPGLEINATSHQGGGMDAPHEIDIGMNVMDVEMTFADIDPELKKKIGMTELQMELRGAIKRQGEAAEQAKIIMRGLFKTVDHGAWERDSRPTNTYTGNLKFYKEEQAGEELVYVDILNHIRRIGGTDQLESERAALGI